MSKLIDKLNVTSDATPQPMGFGRSKAAAPKPRLVLVASLSQANLDGMAEYVTGADAALWHITAGADIKALQAKAQSMCPDIPWGCWLSGTSREEMEQVNNIDFDFVVLPATTPVATRKDKKAGYVLQVDTSLSDGLVRSIDQLPIDAVLATGEQPPGDYLNWRQLMLFQRFAGLLEKPLLVTVPPTTAASELQALWNAGVAGIVVAAESSKTVVCDLRQQIDKLSVPPRKRGKAEPLLPRITQEADVIVEEEEEEEEP